MARRFVLVYGVICYLISLGVVAYAVGWVGDWVVPRSVDSGAGAGTGQALLIDMGLLALFAIPHSVMARPGFKAWWTQWVPGPMERSTYVLISSLLLALLLWQWRPLPAVVWQVDHPAGRLTLHAWSLLGGVVMLVSTFLTNHFDLFGLRQVYLHARGWPYAPPEFRTPSLYRVVRHPMMLGLLIALWATPKMTAGHLLFAAATTVYILIAVRLEERDLVAVYGKAYQDYQQRAGMLLPLGVFLGRR